MTTRTVFKRILQSIHWWPLILLVALTAACDGASSAQVIATYPRRAEATERSVVQSAEVELSVHDAGEAAEQVSRLVATHGGYVVDSQRWYWQGQEQASVTARVPAAEFTSFYRALLRLGVLVSERVTEVADGHPERYTHVSVTLRSSPRPIRPDAADGWQPADTVGAAFAVFVHLFQAVVDGLIWIAVVAGPFALMVLGLATLVRYVHRLGSRDDEGSGGDGEMS